MAYLSNRLQIYYWADEQLAKLRVVNVMPDIYYRCLYQVSMRLAESGRFRRLAYWVIHTTAYHVRFEVS